MKYATLLLLALVLLAAPGAAGKSKAGRRCYTVRTQYCWVYRSCGVVRKRRVQKQRCTRKFCVRECDVKCHNEMRKRGALGCRKTGGKYAKCKYSWLAVPRQRCKRRCTKRCQRKRAVCRVTKVYAYPKLCAYKHRVYRKTRGHVKKPKPIVLRRKLVRTIHGKKDK